MNAIERRGKIAEILKKSEVAVSATSLAHELSVSRQIVVGDVALLRASGMEIISTARGYLMNNTQAGKLYSIVCVHDDKGIEQELQIMVDHGCYVQDVIIEHPVYGSLTGELRISNRYDVSQFMEKIDEHDAPPLSRLTGGIHIHRLLCKSEADFMRCSEDLRKHGFLLDE